MPRYFINESGQRLNDFPAPGTGTMPLLNLVVLLLNQVLELVKIVQAHFWIGGNIPNRRKVEVELMEMGFGTHDACRNLQKDWVMGARWVPLIESCILRKTKEYERFNCPDRNQDLGFV